MALVFQVAISTIVFVRARWGTTGVYATASVLGLTDVDALTMSMSRLDGGVARRDRGERDRRRDPHEHGHETGPEHRVRRLGVPPGRRAGAARASGVVTVLALLV